MMLVTLGRGMAGKQNGGAFSPLALAGLAAWYDAADTATITIETGAAQWADKSGNGNHAVQETASAQPASGTRTVNGLNVLDFGGNDFMTLTSAISRSNGYTVFAIVDTANISSNKAVFAGPSGSFDIRINSSETPQIVRVNQAVLLSAGSSLSADTPAILSAQSSSSGNNLHINGVSVGSNSTNPSYSTDSNIIGAQDGGAGDQWDGLIGELIIYDRILDSIEMNQIGNYLSAKWGVSWAGL